MRNATKYYGVRQGTVPGVYTTWSECLAQIKGFPKAAYKSFMTREDAVDYVNGGTGDLPKWFGVRAGHAPGVYKTMEEVTEQVKGYTGAQFQLFGSRAEAESYIAQPASPSAKRKRRASDAADQDASTQEPQRKQRRKNGEQPAAASRFSAINIQRSFQDDEGTDELVVENDAEEVQRDIQTAPAHTVTRNKPERRGDRRKQQEEQPPPVPSAVESTDLQELQEENLQLAAEIQLLREQLANASAGPDDAFKEAVEVFTVLLAKNNSADKHQAPYPEVNQTVIGVFDNGTDAQEAAWEAYRDHCGDHESMQMTDMGITEEPLDRRSVKAGSCHHRRTKLGELRLYWRDMHNRAGLVIVQSRTVRTAKMQPSRAVAAHDDAPEECYLVCEHYQAHGINFQDGGMLGAYRSLVTANSKAREAFRKRYKWKESKPIVEVSDVSKTANSGHGAWLCQQEGRAVFIREHEKGRGKIWVEKFLVK